MNSKNAIKGDYKKWLLYSFEKQDFNDHYSLFKSLNEGVNVGNVCFSKNDDEVASYSISHKDLSDDLEINEAQRKSFKEYLIENYFKTERIDELLHERTQGAEKEKNHAFLKANTDSIGEQNEIKIKVHPKEHTYYGIKLFFSVLFYIVILGALGYLSITNVSIVLGGLAVVLPIIFFLWLSYKFLVGIFIGQIRGSSLRVTIDQFPEIYTIIEEQASKLKVEKLPEIYITSGHFNAFVTRFSRTSILMIYSEVIETTRDGNYDVLKYVTGHELCHIKQKHLSKRLLLFPSSLIPFLSLAYSRACEYTCDRVGYSFSPKGSIEGILIMTIGKEIHSKLNIEAHIKNSIENAGFWVWVGEKFLTHPYHYKRLIEIKKYSKFN